MARVDALLDTEFEHTLQRLELGQGYKLTYLEKRGIDRFAQPKQQKEKSGVGGKRPKRFCADVPSLGLQLSGEGLKALFGSFGPKSVQWPKHEPSIGLALDQKQCTAVLRALVSHCLEKAQNCYGDKTFFEAMEARFQDLGWTPAKASIVP